MFRYVALIWSPADAEQAQAAALVAGRLHSSATRWHIVLRRAGLHVYCADVTSASLTAHVLADTGGVILGTVFLRHDEPQSDAACRHAELGPQQSAAIAASRGRWLIEHCWGNYVAILPDPDGVRCRVVKDPCGALPCFSTAFERVTLLFSAIADCIDLQLLRFTINMPYLEQRLLSGNLTQHQTALNEVTQICRGECAEIDPRRQPAPAGKHMYWHPMSFPRAREAIDDADRAGWMLRDVLHACTRSLVARHESVLLRLSGGLDSSIVLSCLNHASSHRNLLAYTQYIDDAACDPRPWARMAAQHAACEHIEQLVRPGDIRLQALLEIAPSAEPVAASMFLTIGLREQHLAHERAATAVFTGDGGDCAFGSLCVGDALPAYLRRKGLTPFAFRLAAECALVLRQTVWAVLARGLRAWISADPGANVTEKNRDACRLVSRDLVERIDAYPDPHPWLRSAGHLRWDAVSKLGALLGTPDLYAGVARPSDSAPEILSPIYAQPVMETCLRIPADVLFTGGCDRGLARRAFMGEVPDPILRRVWKDRAGTFHDQLVQLNLPWLREMLLDGVLVHERMLDRDAVEAVLANGPSGTHVHAGEVMRHLETELWARHWASRRESLRGAARSRAAAR